MIYVRRASMTDLMPARGEVMTELDELATTANREIALAEEAADNWYHHALLAGQALYLAWQKSPFGTWTPWLDTNFQKGRTAARIYMKLWVYRDEIPPGTSSRAAQQLLAGKPKLLSTNRNACPLPKQTQDEIRRRRAAGDGWNSIASDLGVRRNALKYWFDPEFRKKEIAAATERASAKARARRDQAKALKQLERDEIARNRPGDLSKAYAGIRKQLLVLDAAIANASTEESRRLTRQAMTYAHKCEDAIVAALRSER